MNEEETIKRLKKLDEPTFVCQHIFANTYLNLNFPYDMEEDNEAWCDECEKKIKKKGGGLREPSNSQT